MKYKFNRIPYYAVKLLLTPLGLGSVASYWEEKNAYKKISKLLKWAETDYSNQTAINNEIEPNKTIWIYWRQGLENAPEIVKKCVNSAKCHNANRKIVILSECNINDFVQFPDFIEKKHKDGVISEAHYSDLLRIELLIQYGGVWMDATCYSTKEIPDYVNESDLFMFSTGNWWPWLMNPSKCSNWFIKSNKDNILLRKLRNFLFEHWRNRNRAIHYYVFHFALSALAEYDIECRRIWNKVPFVSNLLPHYFMYSFAKPYRYDEYNYALDQCFIHKCSYKFDKSLLQKKEENYLQHFLKEHGESTIR